MCRKNTQCGLHANTSLVSRYYELFMDCLMLLQCFFCMLQRVIEHITQCNNIKPRIAQTNKFIGKIKKI